ncbi:DUF1697 domain-containing protein [Vicingus serpentipes]|uniref:DUF1697 domain-containing protein n=2 Tax=Vicingus serpentipes TaxID=1926625 RepID=A0A5C6RTG6_9FLAO|nr:DUF1697 domain-containing protein [Vicingus serpentipes]
METQTRRMKIYIALLRGINVSGHKLIKMTELKSMFEKAEFKNVTTYIQSGNVVFSSKKEDIVSIQETIKTNILKVFGFDVDVQVLGAEKLQRITENHTFLEGNQDQLKAVYYTLLAEKPNSEFVKELEQLEQTEEFFKITDEVIYCFYPNGVGRAKWQGTFFEKKLKVSSTTRNYNTMKKLTELSKEVD